MRASLVFAVGILGLLLCHGRVQAQSAKKGPLDLNAQVQFSDSYNKGKTDLYNIVRPQQRAPTPAYLSIVQVTAYRYGSRGITITGNLSNPTLKTVSGATYSIERWNGKAWSVVKSGQLEPVKTKELPVVRAEWPSSKEAMWFRVVVSKSVEGAKQVALPQAQESWVLQYRCPEWQVWPKGHEDLKFQRAWLINRGFEVSSGGPVVLYRCVNWQERTYHVFDHSYAQRFRDSLPQAGLEAKIFAR